MLQGVTATLISSLLDMASKAVYGNGFIATIAKHLCHLGGKW